MINKSLNPKVFDNDVEMKAIRYGYGEGLSKVGRLDKNVVALCADLTESTNTHKFRNEFPNRFIEMGIGEQSMASVASGMAAMGKIPFIASYAMFSPGRNWEQIRTTICYNDSNVKIIGCHAGISVGQDGGTHQAIEDIAITRVIPRMTVIAPIDSVEAEKAVIASAKHCGPVYIRLAKEDTPVITTKDTKFEIGKLNVLLESEKPNVLMITTGSAAYNSLIAANELNSIGIDTTLLSLSTIKPIDEYILEYAKDVDIVVTTETHQIAGGMGSAVAELLSSKFPKKIMRIGVDDKFGESGTPEELIKHHSLDSDSIVKSVLATFKKDSL